MFPQYQMPLFQPASGWKPTPVSQLPSWKGVKRIGYDTETYDPLLTKLGPGVRRGGKVIGFSFAIEDGPAFYLPIGHPEDNLPREHVINYLKDQAKEFDGEIVGANLGYDLDYTWSLGIEFPKVKRFRDIQVAEPLIDELQLSYSLHNVAKRHGLPGKDESLLRETAALCRVDPKKGMWQMPARFVGPYATEDSVLPLRILRRQERLIDDNDLWDIYDLESRLTPILTRMRCRGVRIDFKHLQYVEDWSLQEQQKELDKVKEATGFRLAIEDVNKAKALEMPLKSIGAQIKRTATGLPSIDKDFLAGLKHPVASSILRAKKMDKLRNTFCRSLRDHAVNGRVHSTFNQMRRASDDEGDDDTGARYGRLSSTDPNLQQQPARDPEIGKLWRMVYLPEDGEMWAAMDYSQQEPRLCVHWGVKAGCAGAESMAQEFRTDPKCDNHTTMTRLVYGNDAPSRADFKKLRGYCKEIFLGICYGMGGAKLCKKLGLPTEWIHSQRMGRQIEVAGTDGKAIIDEIDRKLPYLRQLARLAENRAKQMGYIRTLLGRRCRFPVKPAAKPGDAVEYDWCHKALNRLIQGSAADQTKKALVTMAELFGVPLLQVHDEIDDSVPNAQEAEKRADIMRHCVPLEVPSKVDVELGKSWGDSM